MKQIIFTIISLLVCNFVMADDYKLDPKPHYNQGSAHELFSFDPPSDPELCGIYLKNIRHFAKKNSAMSCETPVWSELKDHIQHVEWEDLDPNEHEELFEALVAKRKFMPANIKPNIQDVNYQRGLVKNREFLFRRAKIEFRGRQDFDENSGSPMPAEDVTFYLVQYGENEYVDSPQQRFACKPTRGGPSIESATYYFVTKDLHRIYGGVYSMADGAFFRDWFIINGKPYMEEKRSNGDIRLSELSTKPAVILQPACLYHFRKF